jgi:hypothetical protein
MTSERWPTLPVAEWDDTRDTLHRWTQIVGKTRLSLTPLVNHWWNSTLYVSARGLRTGTMHSGDVALEIELDLVDHTLEIRSSQWQVIRLPLVPQSVADFYREYVDSLRTLGIDLHIHATPNEVEDATPFAEDQKHCSYDPEYANRFWRILSESDRVFTKFRARFVGKASPSHFFWGAMDLAVTRFSGRPAPKHPGGAPHCPDYVQIEGYSHELTSAGFWPGAKGQMDNPVYYAYAYPEPKGYSAEKVQPAEAFYHQDLKEFILPYETVRTSKSPDDTLLDFLESTYEAGAKLLKWDRAALERSSPGPAR